MKAILTVGMILAAGAAQAQDPSDGGCKPVSEMVEFLAGFGEVPLTQFYSTSQAVTAFVSPFDAGTWTITVTRPDGMTCIVAFGANWAFVAPAPGDPS